MTLASGGVAIDDYASALREYLSDRSERALYRASQLASAFVSERVGPDDILALHVEALEHATEGATAREMALAATDGLQFLLEVMIGYGARHKEYLEQRLDELARSDMNRNEILAAVAHELRTPLTTVKGNLDLAERRLARGEASEVPPLLGQSRTAVERLVRMTGDLLDASRGQAPEVRRVREELSPLLAQAVAGATSAAAEKGIGITLEASTPGICVDGDADGLHSVFANLLSNAVRYTPAGGRVAVRIGADDDWAWAEVSDTGVGMTPEVQARVFERFYRAPEAQLAVPQGLGLGLALVQQTVEAHGGRVELTSAPGQGSTFRVVLPCTTEEPQTAR